MLREVTIERYKSCRGVKLTNLGPVVALVGDNGVGKTNILRAIEWAARVAVADDILTEKFPFEGGEVGLVFLDAGRRLLKYSLSVHWPLTPVQGDPFHIDLSEIYEKKRGRRFEPVLVRDGNTVNLPDAGGMKLLRVGRGPAVSVLKAALPPESPANESLKPFESFFKGVRYYAPRESADRLGDWPVTVDGISRGARIDQEPGSEDAPLKLIRLFVHRRDDFEEVHHWLRGLDLVEEMNVVKAEFVSGPSPDYYAVVFRTKGLPTKIPLMFSDLSQGTRRVVRILTDFISDDSRVCLLEHPEDGIHRSLLWKLLKLLTAKARRERRQIVMTSHSHRVVDMLEPDQVRIVTADQGGTAVRGLSEREQANALSYRKTNGNLSDYLEILED